MTIGAETLREIEAHGFGARAAACGCGISGLLDWAAFVAASAGGFVGHLQPALGEAAFLALVYGNGRPQETRPPSRSFLLDAARASEAPRLLSTLTEVTMFLSARCRERQAIEASFSMPGVRIDLARGMHVFRSGSGEYRSDNGIDSPPAKGRALGRNFAAALRRRLGGGCGFVVSVDASGKRLAAIAGGEPGRISKGEIVREGGLLMLQRGGEHLASRECSSVGSGPLKVIEIG